MSKWHMCGFEFTRADHRGKPALGVYQAAREAQGTVAKGALVAHIRWFPRYPEARIGAGYNVVTPGGTEVCEWRWDMARDAAQWFVTTGGQTRFARVLQEEREDAIWIDGDKAFDTYFGGQG